MAMEEMPIFTRSFDFLSWRLPSFCANTLRLPGTVLGRQLEFRQHARAGRLFRVSYFGSTGLNEKNFPRWIFFLGVWLYFWVILNRLFSQLFS